MKIRRPLAGLLAFAMLVSLMVVPVSAVDITKDSFELKADATVTVDGTADQTVNVVLSAKEAMTIIACEGTFSTEETEDSSYLSLTGYVSPVTLSGMNYFYVDTGSVVYSDGNLEGYEVEQNGNVMTAVYTVNKNTPAGTYTVEFSAKNLQEYDFNKVEMVTYTATITVTNSSAGGSTTTNPYEIYYTLDSTADTETTPDGYMEYDIDTDNTVTATVKLKNNSGADTYLQAYDLYLAYNSNLTYTATTIAGTVHQDADNKLTHIQAVGEDDGENAVLTAMEFKSGAEITLGTITFEISEDAVYDTQMPITLTVGSDSKTVTNIGVGGAVTGTEANGEGDSTSYYPVDTSTVDGVEVMTTYTVSYDANEGTGAPEAQTKEYNKSLTLSSTEPTREGYTFKGWNTVKEPTTENPGTAYAAGANYAANEGTTLYAQWQLNTVTVTFNANEGSGTMEDQKVEYGVATALKANTFTRTGYTFADWNTKADGTGTSYADGANITITAATTLYAQWTINKYTVTWYNQDGSAALETDSNVEYGAAPSYDSDEPTKESTEQYEYTFAGWATEKDQESGKPMSELPTVSGNADYYAAFSKTERSYTVSFNANTTETVSGMPAEQTIVYNNTATEPTAPTADHYTFGGWYTDSTCTTAYNFSTEVTGDVTLYAKWTAKTYTVTFEAGEGSGFMENQTFTYGVSQALNANSFTAPTGKTFDGWKDAEDNTYTDKQSISLTKNISLTAQWSNNEYSVSADENVENGTVSVNKSSANYNDTITVTVTPGAGYRIETVTYKYTDAEGDEHSVTVSAADGSYSFTMPAYNVTVSATFTAIDYTVTVDSNISNGAVEATIAGNKTYANVRDKVTLTADPDDGYKLKEYSVTYTYTDAEGATQTSAVTVTDGEFTMPAYDVTVSATFEGVSYTIAYDSNGGTGNMNSTPAVYGTPVALSENIFSRTGYTFKGWAATSNGTVAYGDKDEVSTLTTTEGGTVTLYAVWEADTCTVTLDANGGKVNDKDTDIITVTYDAAYGSGLVDPVRTGYTFDGWYTTNDSIGTKVKSTTTVATAGNHTLYAKWTAKEYTVTLNHNYTGSTDSTITVTYNSTYSSLTTPVREGYTFDGWYTTNDSNGTEVESTTTVATAENHTLYAMWKANEYTITLNLNGGYSINNADGWTKGTDGNYTMTYTIESDVTLPSALYQGFYGFNVWNVETTAGNWTAGDYNATTYTEKYGDVTLTAQWNGNLTCAVEEYKYAGTGYWLLCVDATFLDPQADRTDLEFRFNGTPMYYTADTNYQVPGSSNSTGTFYTLIPVSENGVTYIDTTTGKLTEDGYSKISASECDNGERSTITYNGDINGDGVVNVADANVVYQMVVNGGAYYGNLSIEQRLAADMVKATSNANKRGSIEDVNAIVTIINTNTTT